RSGDPEDVARLLLAGLVAQADLDEKADRAGDAATLLEIAAQRFPADPTVQVRAAEALLEDRHDPAGAPALLTPPTSTPAEPPRRSGRAGLPADALDRRGRRAEARVVLERLQTEFPDTTRLRGRLARADARPPTERQP